MNEQAAAALLGYTPRALQNWRLRGGGPIFVKVSARSVRYRHCDLMTWIEAKLHRSSTDPVRNHRHREQSETSTNSFNHSLSRARERG